MLRKDFNENLNKIIYNVPTKDSFEIQGLLSKIPTSYYNYLLKAKTNDEINLQILSEFMNKELKIDITQTFNAFNISAKSELYSANLYVLSGLSTRFDNDRMHIGGFSSKQINENGLLLRDIDCTYFKEKVDDEVGFNTFYANDYKDSESDVRKYVSTLDNDSDLDNFDFI